jgi:hypothetical protein
MSRAHKIILVVSFLLMLVCFIHDLLYDPPPSPYITTDYIIEFILMGALYTAIFFGIILGVYLSIKKIIQKITTHFS